MKKINRAWRSYLLVFFLFVAAVICARLGLWQHTRWLEKKQIVAQLDQEKKRQAELVTQWDQHFRPYHRIVVTGTWLAEKQFLLANQMHRGQYGYDVITPLKGRGDAPYLLVDRGWVKATSESKPPLVPLHAGRLSLTGYVYYPPSRQFLIGSFWLKPMAWPQQMQGLKPSLIAQQLGHSVLPFVVRMESPRQYTYMTDWPVVSFPPSRHLSYMIQWLFFAGLLLLGAVLISWKIRKKR